MTLLTAIYVIISVLINTIWRLIFSINTMERKNKNMLVLLKVAVMLVILNKTIETTWEISTKLKLILEDIINKRNLVSELMYN